jgi:hypothetical protein
VQLILRVLCGSQLPAKEMRLILQVSVLSQRCTSFASVLVEGSTNQVIHIVRRSSSVESVLVERLANQVAGEIHFLHIVSAFFPR